MNDLKHMAPEQLRRLIAQAETQLLELEPPGKRWTVHLSRVRVVHE